ncbi:hypothetical protein HNI00_16250 [Thermoleptolyngbya oregonensis NK1-22]|uniref:Uncharacterized protein n=1 Tax=Thermoleptolyngbya oregonensis NK1-22 TaxID=2547457 RepID=A0AA96Y6M3_9CYAN|nr:hypothetical protein [Thermoleptolyngbya oregonensis]WOB44526.1 hypothetical protein HNI00_16250 [Thermoleptolyngbya oregonensis NK1-22]
MQKWVADGLVVGLATIVLGGTASALFPRNSIASIASSSLGAVSSSMVLARRRTRLSPESEEPEENVYPQLPELSEKHVSGVLEESDSAEHTPFSEPVLDKNSKASLIENPSTNPSTEDTAEESENLQLLDGRLSEEVAIKWLANRGVSVMDQPELDPHTEEIFNKHAVRLGNKYKDEDGQPQLSRLLGQIKWSIINERNLTCHLNRASQKQIGTITQFGKDLDKDTLFFSRYKYFPGEKIIRASVRNRPDTRSFFTGGWFERFIEYKVSDFLQRSNLSYSRLMNRLIQFSNGDSFELDLFYVVEGKPLLIECKTGRDRDAYQKFSDRRKRLSISPERAFLVILDFDPGETERLSAVWKFNIVGQDNLIPQIEAGLGSN